MSRFLIYLLGVSGLIVSWHFLPPNIAPTFNVYSLLFLLLLIALSYANILPFPQWLGVRKSTPPPIPVTESKFGVLVLADGTDPTVELVPQLCSNHNRNE
jgi:hypothetical protein